MTLNKRIREIKNYYFGEKKGSHKKFIEKLGVKSNTASNYMKDGYSVGKSVTDNILNVFPDVSAGWLLAGEGSMLKNAESMVSEPQAAYGSDTASLIKENKELKEQIKNMKYRLDFAEYKIKAQEDALAQKEKLVLSLQQTIDILSSMKEKKAQQ